ncbi:MAG: membrane protein insertase YidC [Clostridia bacterium]|nr:membrane protein insertase YidC [Clostridia bacterium]
MWNFFAKPFGVLMEFIYNTVAFENYGIAIIIFSIFVRLLMLPLNIKQQRSMERQQALMPEIEAIKRQYKDDPKKSQEEQALLFNRHQINPYSGCLPLLIQYPLIIVVYQIIRRPLTYIAGLSAAQITTLANSFNINAANEIAINAKLGASEAVNMKFLGIFDLGITPSWKVWEYGAEWKVLLPLLLIPILSLATAYLQQHLTMKYSGNGQASAGMMGGMLKIMPLMSLVFAFMLPAGVGLYWIMGNVLGIVQTILLKKVFVTKKKEGCV